MTIAAMRERAHELVDEANDVELVEILAKLEGETDAPWQWHNDEEFLADLDEQVKRIQTGIDRAIPLEEVKANMARMKAERTNARK